VTSITLARKYSRALLEIGLKDGTHETLGQELERIAQLLLTQKELRNVLYSSVYPSSIRKGIFQNLSRSLRLSPVMVDFVNLLIDRERINHLPVIAQSYSDLSDELANRIRATLLTAKPLSPSRIGEIQNQLEASVRKKIILAVQEEPDLIGGVVAKIGNLIYDGSLKTQLSRMKENLYKE
jgi:F-type H+-transporting ATPase subunit delta